MACSKLMLGLVTIAACAGAPTPLSRGANDPSNPSAAETPMAPAGVDPPATARPLIEAGVPAAHHHHPDPGGGP